MSGYQFPPTLAGAVLFVVVLPATLRIYGVPKQNSGMNRTPPSVLLLTVSSPKVRFLTLTTLFVIGSCGPPSLGPDVDSLLSDPTFTFGVMADSVYSEAQFPVFTFGVMGDLPYWAKSEAQFPSLVDSINAHDPDFVVHVGDIMSSKVPCTDSLFLNRFEALKSIDPPLVFVPGDNEWTDCHGGPSGVNDPLERLDALRTLFYPVPGRSLGGETIPLETQASDPDWAEFVEHQRWQKNGVLFATIHAIGSLNGLKWFEGRTSLHDQEVDRRIAAATVWLHSSFEKARAEEASAVVIVTHANLWYVPEDPPRSGFEEIIDALVAESKAFANPVLLVHGDTHTFRVDQPMTDSEGVILNNVVRLETYGGGNVGWIEVTVDLEEGPLVFSFTPDPPLFCGTPIASAMSSFVRCRPPV